jgi:tetratricopeptide (TPR) repeat protein
MNSTLKNLAKRFKVHHYVAFAAVLAIGIFNAVTIYSPIIKQNNREKNITETFETWWEEEGAAQFMAVGLTADDKLKQEEFEQYRERYLQQNHTYIVEDRVKEMRQEFRKWWEIGGGKEDYVKEHSTYPNERDFNREQDKWIKAYTSKFPRYGLAFVPKDQNYGQLFTTWFLFPGMASFLVFAVLFLFSFTLLCRRWGSAITTGIFIGIALIGALPVQMLTFTSFFDHYADSRYMGASLALAFLLGATSFHPRKGEIPHWVIATSVLGAMLDMLLNWKLYSGIFGAVAALTPVLFALGALAGLKIPERVKSQKELANEAIENRLRRSAGTNLAAERKVKNRQMFDSGFNEVKAGRIENAQRIIAQAVSSILQEHPVVPEDVLLVAEKLTSPDTYVDFPSLQWLEWGESAKNKNVMDAALLLLEKGLKLEKNANIARRALYNIGEIRILRGIDREEGVRRLNQVIEMNGNDILAAQSKKLLERVAPKKPKAGPANPFSR